MLKKSFVSVLVFLLIFSCVIPPFARASNDNGIETSAGNGGNGTVSCTADKNKVTVTWDYNANITLNITRDGVQFKKITDTKTASIEIVESEPGYHIYVATVFNKSEKHIFSSSSCSVYGLPQVRLEYINQTSQDYVDRLYPYFILYNIGSSNIDLKKISVRYYYTINGEPIYGQQYWVNDGKINPGDIMAKDNIALSFTKLTNPLPKADYYCNISFLKSQMLNTGSNIRVQPEFIKNVGNNDVRQYRQSDDYSFISSASQYTENTKMCVYYDNNLIWGNEPAGALTAPNLSSAIVDGNKIKLSWNTVSGATKYVVTIIKDGNPYTFEVANNTYTTDVLQPGSYVCTVKAMNGNTVGPESSSQTVVIQQSVPVLKSSIVNGNAVKLDWNSITGVTNYTITMTKDGELLPSKDIEGTSYTTAALSPGTYTYRVSTINGPQSNQETILIPGAPTGLLASPSYSDITLSWNSISDVSKYVLLRKTSDQSNYSVLRDNITGNSYIDTSVSKGITYQYKVKAVTAKGAEGPLSDSASGSLKDTGINGLYGRYYNWTAAEGHYDSHLADGTLTSYIKNIVYNISTTTVPAMSRIDSTIDFKWGGGKEIVDPEVDSPMPGVVNDDNFYIVWDGYLMPTSSDWYYFRTDADDGVKLWLDKNNDGVFQSSECCINDWNDLHNTATETSGWMQLNKGTKYKIKLEYFENEGHSDVKLSWCNYNNGQGTCTVIPTSQLNIPDEALQPNNLRVTYNENGSVTLSWDKVVNANGYYLYDTTSGGIQKTELSGDQISITLTDVAAGEHSFSVCAFNDKGESDPSNIIKVYIPAAPVIRAVSANGNIKLEWDGISGVSKYKVYREANGESQFAEVDTVTTNYYLDTTAIPGTTYSYKIKAITANGAQSSFSNVVSATAASTLTAPDNFKVVTSGKSVKISWDNVTDATGYIIYKTDKKTSVTTEISISVIDQNEYTDNIVDWGCSYQYSICAIKGSLKGVESPKKDADIEQSKITEFKVTADDFDAKIKLEWNSQGAASYKIYRSESINGEFDFVDSTTTKSYTDTNGLTSSKDGKWYFYKVVGIAGNGTEDVSSNIEGVALYSTIQTSVGYIKCNIINEDGSDNNKFGLGLYVPLQFEIKFNQTVTNPALILNKDLVGSPTTTDPFEVKCITVNGQNSKAYCNNVEVKTLLDETGNPTISVIEGTFERDTVLKIEVVVKVSATPEGLRDGISKYCNKTYGVKFEIGYKDGSGQKKTVSTDIYNKDITINLIVTNNKSLK